MDKILGKGYVCAMKESGMVGGVKRTSVVVAVVSWWYEGGCGWPDEDLRMRGRARAGFRDGLCRKLRV